MQIDISGEFEILYTLYMQGFDFRNKVGMLLLEVHQAHPQEPDDELVNCCYGPKDMNWLYSMLFAEGFKLVAEEQFCIGAEIAFVNPHFPGFVRRPGLSATECADRVARHSAFAYGDARCY